MGRDQSIMAVKTAIGGETYFGYVDVIVENSGRIFLYRHVCVRVSYNYGYMQMDVSVIWDNDGKQVDYRTLDLHVGYNTNYQDFSFDGIYLKWRDGRNNISIQF